MNDIRLKAIKFEAEKYGYATNEFVDGFMDGYNQGKAEAIKDFAEEVKDYIMEHRSFEEGITTEEIDYLVLDVFKRS